MQGDEKNQQKPNHCELCAMPSFKDPGRHMKRYHKELGKVPFRRLEPGHLPIGAWKYCSNWQEIWNDNFEAKDTEFKTGKEFQLRNKVAKKQKSKENKRTLLYHYCKNLHPLGECANADGENPLKIYRPSQKCSKLNETEMGCVLEDIIDQNKQIKNLNEIIKQLNVTIDSLKNKQLAQPEACRT